MSYFVPDFFIFVGSKIRPQILTVGVIRPPVVASGSTVAPCIRIPIFIAWKQNERGLKYVSFVKIEFGRLKQIFD